MKSRKYMEQEIFDDYQGKPYALIIAVLLGICGIIVGGTYLFMTLINLIWG
jgi:hypothetical protein